MARSSVVAIFYTSYVFIYLLPFPSFPLQILRLPGHLTLTHAYPRFQIALAFTLTLILTLTFTFTLTRTRDCLGDARGGGERPAQASSPLEEDLGHGERLLL